MKVLLDEDVPVPLIKLVQHILRGHTVDHVYQIGWKGKSDVNIYKDARARGYDAVITNNIRQLSDPDECDAIKKSGKHLILYGMERLARTCAGFRSYLRSYSARDRRPHRSQSAAPRANHGPGREEEALRDLRSLTEPAKPLLALAQPRLDPAMSFTPPNGPTLQWA